jgi:hypothetical protein
MTFPEFLLLRQSRHIYYKCGSTIIQLNRSSLDRTRCSIFAASIDRPCLDFYFPRIVLDVFASCLPPRENVSTSPRCFCLNIMATKAFDRVNHGLLFRKLQDRNVPPCLINTLACWYSKLYAVVRWNASFSENFQVCCGVRQGGILSPFLFNVYMLMI